MSHSHFRSGAALAMVLAASPVSAQAWTRDWPQPGDPVRVTSSAPPYERAHMTFQRQANDTLVFARSSGLSRAQLETPIALSDITRLEMPGVPKSEHRRRAQGALAGLIIGGVAVGSLLYFTTDFSCRSTDTCNEFGPEFTQKVRATVGFLGGGLAGSVVGWNIGARYHSETWRTIR